jgi:hypothetical protein
MESDDLDWLRIGTDMSEQELSILPFRLAELRYHFRARCFRSRPRWLRSALEGGRRTQRKWKLTRLLPDQKNAASRPLRLCRPRIHRTATPLRADRNHCRAMTLLFVYFHPIQGAAKPAASPRNICVKYNPSSIFIPGAALLKSLSRDSG